jgi:hypothetical protein
MAFFEKLLLIRTRAKYKKRGPGCRRNPVWVAEMFDGRMQIQGSVSSPNGQLLAACVETKNWLGLKTRQGGFLYAFRDRAPIGRIFLGKRGADGWAREKIL